MERRNFLKAGFLTIFSLYGLSATMSCFAGRINPTAHPTGTGRGPFTGVYSGTLTNERVMMPEVFSRLLVKEPFVLVVPESNTSALLIPEKSPEWERLRQLFDAADKDNVLMLRQRAEIDEAGNLHLPESVSKFAGIQTPAIAIVGQGYMIEIIDSDRYHSRID